jgi:hypothetical protein
MGNCGYLCVVGLLCDDEEMVVKVVIANSANELFAEVWRCDDVECVRHIIPNTLRLMEMCREGVATTNIFDIWLCMILYSILGMEVT